MSEELNGGDTVVGKENEQRKIVSEFHLSYREAMRKAGEEVPGFMNMPGDSSEVNERERYNYRPKPASGIKNILKVGNKREPDNGSNKYGTREDVVIDFLRESGWESVGRDDIDEGDVVVLVSKLGVPLNVHRKTTFNLDEYYNPGIVVAEVQEGHRIRLSKMHELTEPFVGNGQLEEKSKVLRRLNFLNVGSDEGDTGVLNENCMIFRPPGNNN